MEDSAILDLYFARDEAAVARTAEKCGSRLRGLAERMLASRPDAEECENDAYLAAWNAIPPQRPRYFFAWLAKVVRRLCLDRLKARAAERRSALVVELTDELAQCIPAPEPPEDTDVSQVIRAFVDGLAGDEKYLFVRRYWYMDSVSDLAEDMGWGESRVKSMLARTRKRLKARLEKEGFHP